MRLPASGSFTRLSIFALLFASLLLASCGQAPNNPVMTATVSSLFQQTAPDSTASPTLAASPVPTGAPTQTSVIAVTASTATPAASPTVLTSPTSASTPTIASQATASPAATATGNTTLPDPSGYTWSPLVTGLAFPLDMKVPPDGSGRFFIVEKRGIIQILKDGKLVSEPFLNIMNKVLSRGSEQGLLGLAFDPQYAQNGTFYIDYIDLNGNTVVARYSVSQSNPDQADRASEQILLHVSQPFPNHNGGEVMFGPDGYLYIGLGDGGSGGDPQGNGQSVYTLLGKILRIDVHSAGSGDTPYGIPPDNAFAQGGGFGEIWAYGLRNPWRFSFDMATGDMYIADVGQDAWEEVNYLPASTPSGANFGWNYREGLHPYKGTPPPGANLTDPVFNYSHSEGCSITGGYVYRGKSLPEFNGVYLFADFCSGNIWGMICAQDGTWQTQKLFRETMSISSFAQDPHGEIYILDGGHGAIYQLTKK